MKSPGDTVLAGTLNESSSVQIEALASVKESSLGIIIEQIKQAQNSKPSIGSVADRISAVFAPLVIIIALITVSVWMNFGPTPQIAYMLVTFMAVLLIACPCALGLAAPISITTGVGKAAQNGILFHQSDSFVDLSKISTIVVNRNIPYLDEVQGLFDKYKLNLIKTEGLGHKELTQKLQEIQPSFAFISDETEEEEFLQQAPISIVIGKKAYQVESDISILPKSAYSLIDAFIISKATLRNIKQNITAAFIYNGVAIPLAAGVLYPLIHTLLNPILAGALMAASSLLVITNANRLHLLRLTTKK